MKKYIIIVTILLLAAACNKQITLPGPKQGVPVPNNPNQLQTNQATSTPDKVQNSHLPTDNENKKQPLITVDDTAGRKTVHLTVGAYLQVDLDNLWSAAQAGNPNVLAASGSSTSSVTKGMACGGFPGSGCTVHHYLFQATGTGTTTIEAWGGCGEATPCPQPKGWRFYVNVAVQSTPVPQNEQVTDETADWKTYSNSKYSYQISYPPDSSLSVSDLNTGAAGHKDVTELPKDADFVTITDGSGFVSVCNDCGGYGVGAYDQHMQTDILIDGKWYEANGFGHNGPDYNNENLFIKLPNLEINYGFNSPSGKPLDDNQALDVETLTSKIISSFKFTNPSN